MNHPEKAFVTSVLEGFANSALGQWHSPVQYEKAILDKNDLQSFLVPIELSRINGAFGAFCANENNIAMICVVATEHQSPQEISINSEKKLEDKFGVKRNE